MPFDIEARVIANIRLSPDYNVIALAAPQIAAAAAPGQFVMVKPGRGHDPLLRRPFSVFEFMRGTESPMADRGGSGATTQPVAPIAGLTLLSKRIGVTTSMLFDAVEGDTVSCLGPLGRAFDLVDPPSEAWIVAGGVGLAPFVMLTDALIGRGTPTTMFYGARTGDELFHVEWFRSRGVRVILTTEDGSVGERGRVTGPLGRELERARGRDVMVYACGPEAMLEAVSHAAARFGTPSQVSVERTMGCGMGGCYSCVIPVRQPGGGHHYVRSCLAGPVFAGADLVWD